jgi:hypothetical protein
MYKRVLDGMGVWKSDKLARIQPEWMRSEYANWIPLALANGVFEADSRRIWATIYSYNRPDISHDDAEKIRREFCRVGLLFLWHDDPTGKVWGYFTGIEKPGRLPARSRLDKKHEPIGPTPPAEDLRSYVELTRSKALEAAVVSQWLGNGCLGFGLGIGFGPGPGKESRASHAPAPSTPGVCEQIVASWNEGCNPFPEVLKLSSERRRKLLARIGSDAEFSSKLFAAIQRAKQTPFLCGAGERGWKANFDWFIANDTNYIAVLEGKYDGGKGGMTHAEQRTHVEAKVGTGPVVPESDSCAECGRTRTFHRIRPDNQQRHAPGWQPHSFVSRQQENSTVSTGQEPERFDCGASA